MARKYGAKRNLPGGNFPVDFGKAAHLSGGSFDADGAIKEGRRDSLKEAGGRTGRVKALDEIKGSEKPQELTSEQEFEEMWRAVDQAADTGGYNIAPFKEEVKDILRRKQEAGLKVADFRMREAMGLVKGMRMAYDQFKGFYERMIDDPKKKPEVFKEAFKYLVEWLEAGNDANQIDTEFLSGLVMNAEAEIQHEEYEESLNEGLTIENLTLEEIYDNLEEVQENMGEERFRQLENRLDNLKKYPEIVKKFDEIVSKLRKFLEQNREKLVGSEEEEEGLEDIVDFYVRHYLGYIVNNEQAGMNGENASEIDVVNFLENTLLRVNNVVADYFTENVEWSEFRESNRMDKIN